MGFLIECLARGLFSWLSYQLKKMRPKVGITRLNNGSAIFKVILVIRVDSFGS